MDNLCHTLAGAALAEAGLKRRTPLATATLLVGANLPDLDAFVYTFGDNATALAFRRGWTHGILAMAALPAVLAGAMLAWDRLIRRGRRSDAPVARFGALLMLAFLSVLSHPLLDFMNVYGMRFLAPFSWSWFYGDALFIVDPWLWIAFALGVAFSRVRARSGRAPSETPARLALGAVAVYAAAMLVSSFAGRGIVRREAIRSASGRVHRVMLSPAPIDPSRREVVVEEASGYRLGRVLFRPAATVSLAGDLLPKNDRDPAAIAASRSPDGRKFLAWARFPYYEVERGRDGATVRIGDARYRDRHGSWAGVTVRVPADRLP